MLAPTKMTAAEKEAQIMKEIRSAAANKKKPVRKFQGSFLGEIFDISLNRNERPW